MLAHRKIQAITKAVLADLVETITPISTEQSIVQTATQMLAERGLSDTWYHQCPALVLLGSRSCISISGRDYAPSDEPVGELNLVTVDLSPSSGGVWGDCARSIFVEQGVARSAPSRRDFLEGYQLLIDLHAAMKQYVVPQTPFQDLWRFSNDRIRAAGFENLDSIGNVGHSITGRLEDRRFIEDGNVEALGSVRCFTFEPHVRALEGRWGFKHEDIYYFNEAGEAQRL